MGYICPVCGYDGLEEAPYDEYNCSSYEICVCCGFEYGFSDGSEGFNFEDYRRKWISEGTKWREPDLKPTNWGLKKQLNNIGVSLTTETK